MGDPIGRSGAVGQDMDGDAGLPQRGQEMCMAALFQHREQRHMDAAARNPLREKRIDQRDKLPLGPAGSQGGVDQQDAPVGKGARVAPPRVRRRQAAKQRIGRQHAVSPRRPNDAAHCPPVGLGKGRGLNDRGCHWPDRQAPGQHPTSQPDPPFVQQGLRNKGPVGGRHPCPGPGCRHAFQQR